MVLQRDRRRVGHRDLGCAVVSARFPHLRGTVLSHGLRELQARFGDAAENQTRVLSWHVAWRSKLLRRKLRRRSSQDVEIAEKLREHLPSNDIALLTLRRSAPL